MNLIHSRHTLHVEVQIARQNERLEPLIAVLEPVLREYLSNGAHKHPLKKSFKLDAETVSGSAVRELELVESLLLEHNTDCASTATSECVVEDLVFHFYCARTRLMETEELETCGDAEGDADPVAASNHWWLPSGAFVGLWQNLIYENGLKEKLLKFALSALTLSQHDVNPNIIACNRLLLLHGPPGTGKTSLCRALAQKLAVRTQSIYRHTHLIEINSHSLFSKWFSESGKLVMRLFAKIRDLVAVRQNLVCVLIDEVESLAYARNCMSGQEPKDAMRVVNALLTQLDSLKEYANVLVLATSNLADTIDLAFLDRADIKQYVGLPGVPAIRTIYESMLLEMMRVGMVRKESLSADDNHEGLLRALAELSVGLSGRTLRKLPFLALTVHADNAMLCVDQPIQLSHFLDDMLEALDKHNLDKELMLKS